MKYIFLVFILMLVLGCTQVAPVPKSQQDFGYYMGNVKPPQTYSVYMSYVDTGFSGVGALNEQATFTVEKTVINFEENFNELELRNMDKQKDTLWQHDFHTSEKIVLDSNTDCFLYTKFPTTIAFACFKDKHLVLTQIITTKGNHQRVTELWKLNDIQYPAHEDSCKEARNSFCDILTSALQNDPNACESLVQQKEYCLSLIE